MRSMEKANTGEKGKSYYGVYFLASVLILYLVAFILDPGNGRVAVRISGDLLARVAPVLLVILLFMAAITYYVNPKSVSRYVGEGSGIKGWLLAIFTGVLSHGPIYIWYPLLKDLRDQGMRKGLIAVFLYNRAIKLPVLPLMIYYFGWMFVIVLLLYMILASIIEGAIIDVIAGKAATIRR